MKTKFKLICMAIVGLGLLPSVAIPQTDGSAGLRVTLRDYTGRSGDDHWTVVWVTTESGTFIKTLWRQGPSISRSHWRDHCRVWYDAKNGSTAFDGFSSATARNYSGVNSPVILTWDCRDAGDNLVPDGNYKFWIQYAEDSGLGPFTTSGLLWTKGSSALTKTYPNQGANFANMRVTWVPSTPPPVPPTITSAEPTATGIVGVPYEYTSEATGTAPIGFSASGLPLGLVMSEAGTISGIPTATGIFAGTVTAANGTPPDATQPFSVTVSQVPARISTVRAEGTSLVMFGNGPSHGFYTVMVSTNLAEPAEQWTPITSGNFDASGMFSTTNTPDGTLLRFFYRLRIP